MKFECRKCGSCCNFNGNLPLYGWEAERLKDVKGLRSLEVFLDKKSGIHFFIQMGLFTDSCPLLKDGQCSIYNERPLICRAYPFISNSFLESEKRISLSNNCPAISALSKEFSEKNNSITDVQGAGRFYQEVFGESFLFSLQYNTIKSFFLSYIKNLEKTGQIKLKKIDKFDAEKIKAIPFERFLLEKGIINDEGYKNLMTLLTNINNLNKLFQLKNLFL